MAVNETDKQAIAGFYKYAFVGIMLEWIGRGMKEDPAAIVERVSVIIHGNVARALEGFCRDNPV